MRGRHRRSRRRRAAAAAADDDLWQFCSAAVCPCHNFSLSVKMAPLLQWRMRTSVHSLVRSGHLLAASGLFCGEGWLGRQPLVRCQEFFALTGSEFGFRGPLVFPSRILGSALSSLSRSSVDEKGRRIGVIHIKNWVIKSA